MGEQLAAPDLGGVPGNPGSRLEQKLIALEDSVASRPRSPGGRDASAPGWPWPELFRVETRSEQDRVLVAAPIGELDLTAAGPLLDLLLELTASEPESLMIDLRSLSFMDCAGVRVLLDTQARARQAELPLSVICAPGQVRRLLALAHADRQLNLAEDPGQPHATPRGAATS